MNATTATQPAVSTPQDRLKTKEHTAEKLLAYISAAVNNGIKLGKDARAIHKLVDDEFARRVAEKKAREDAKNAKIAKVVAA